MKQDELMKFIEFLNSNSGALTLLVTIVYVVTTIIICWANYQSAKAPKEQLEEMKNSMKMRTGLELKQNLSTFNDLSMDYVL